MKRSITLLCLLSTTTVLPFKMDDIWSFFYGEKEREVITREYDISSQDSLHISVFGNVTIKSLQNNNQKVIVHVEGSHDDLQSLSIKTEIHSKQVSIKAHAKNNGTPTPLNYTIIMPRSISLEIKTEKGSLDMQELEGTITAVSDMDIVCNDITNSLKATAQGKIIVHQRKLPRAASLFLKANRGVDLYLTPSINATLHAKTLNGFVNSYIPITLDPITTTLDKNFWNRIKQEVSGNIGDGGAPITIDVTKGNITLFEY